MIDRDSFSKEWIFKQREAYPKADPQLIERQIVAFELIGLLSGTGKDFVFKGGTSLLLLLPTAHRLSIDVDIVGDFSFGELNKLVPHQLSFPINDGAQCSLQLELSSRIRSN